MLAVIDETKPMIAIVRVTKGKTGKKIFFFFFEELYYISQLFYNLSA